MSVIAFTISISISVTFFICANIYLISKQYAITKLIRDSGQVVSSYPLIIMHRVAQERNQRPDIVSPDSYLPPPNYFESEMQRQVQQNNISTITQENPQTSSAAQGQTLNLPIAPPPYVK